MLVLFSIVFLLTITGLLFWAIGAFLFAEGKVYHQNPADYDYDRNEHENYWRGYDGRSN